MYIYIYVYVYTYIYTYIYIYICIIHIYIYIYILVHPTISYYSIALYVGGGHTLRLRARDAEEPRAPPRWHINHNHIQYTFTKLTKCSVTPLI